MEQVMSDFLVKLASSLLESLLRPLFRRARKFWPIFLAVLLGVGSVVALIVLVTLAIRKPADKEKQEQVTQQPPERGVPEGQAKPPVPPVQKDDAAARRRAEDLEKTVRNLEAHVRKLADERARHMEDSARRLTEDKALQLAKELLAEERSRRLLAEQARQLAEQTIRELRVAAEVARKAKATSSAEIVSVTPAKKPPASNEAPVEVWIRVRTFPCHVLEEDFPSFEQALTQCGLEISSSMIEKSPVHGPRWHAVSLCSEWVMKSVTRDQFATLDSALERLRDCGLRVEVKR